MNDTNKNLTSYQKEQQVKDRKEAFKRLEKLKTVRWELKRINDSLQLFKEYEKENKILWFVSDSANKSMLKEVVKGLKNRAQRKQLYLDTLRDQLTCLKKSYEGYYKERLYVSIPTD